MARTRKLKSVEEIERLWEAYTAYCDNHTVNLSVFWHKQGAFVGAEVIKPIPYTLKGFCLFAKIPRATFYEAYSKNVLYLDTITRAREQCQLDARIKFEMGLIPHRLANLWLGVNYGYLRKSKASSGESLVNEWVSAVIG